MKLFIAFSIFSSISSIFGAPSLTWNTFLRAENIFPSSHDGSSSLRANRNGDILHIVNELENLLSRPDILEKIYMNFLNTFIKSKANLELRGLTSPIKDKTMARRAQIFRQKLIEIARHNIKTESGKVSWFKGVTQFADLTKTEFRKTYLNFRVGNLYQENSIYPKLSEGQTPDSIDYRQQGIVSSVKDQNPCGDCYAFASCAVIESAYAQKYSQILDTSEEDIRDCSNQGGCDGGDMTSSWDYVQQAQGIALEQDYPYIFDDQPHSCQGVTQRTANIANHTQIQSGGDESQTIGAVVQYGPIAIGINADDWNDYKGGLYQGNCKGADALNHAVTIVGYNEDSFIIKNSWNTNWGDQGYIYIPRGSNKCGVAEIGYAILAMN